MATETSIPPRTTPRAYPFDPPIAEPAGKEREISVFDLLIVLAEQKRAIFAVVAVCTLVAILIAFLLPKKYTSTAVLLPPQKSSSLGSELASELGALGGMAALAGGGIGMKNPNDLQVALLKSRTVEDGMINQFGLMQEYRDRYISDARKDLEKNVTIDGSRKDGLIRIDVTDRSPARAADLANGYVTQFRSLSEHLAISEASQRRLFFEGQLQQAKDNLAKAEEALKETEQRTGLIQLDSQARALIASAATLRAQVAAKEVQIKALQTFATDQNAALVQANQELETLRAQLKKLGGTESGNEDLIVPKGSVPQVGLEYVRRLRDVKYYETIFEILARQFENAKLDEARQGAIIQVVDAPVVPDKRTSPRRTLIVLVGAGAGLILGVLFAFLRAAYLGMRHDPARSGRLMRLGNALRAGNR